jgi:hypothetical protein
MEHNSEIENFAFAGEELPKTPGELLKTPPNFSQRPENSHNVPEFPNTPGELPKTSRNFSQHPGNFQKRPGMIMSISSFGHKAVGALFRRSETYSRQSV